MLEGREGDGGGGFGCPGAGAGGHVFFLRGLVECGVGEEGVWCWNADVGVVVIEIDHGVVLEVVTHARDVMAD